MDTVPLREYFESRMDVLEERIEALTNLTRRELELLSEERERQRDDLTERLEGMNALRAQLDRQAGTFATNERLRGLERATWRAIGLLAALMMVIQIAVAVFLKVG